MLSGRSIAGYVITTEDGQLSHSDEYCEFYKKEPDADARKFELEEVAAPEKFEVREALLIITRPE